VYGGGRTADRRISVGESSEEWLMISVDSGDSEGGELEAGILEGLQCSGSFQCGLEL
jgi:hypothetical protein